MLKPGEIALGIDPASKPDAGIVFIGHMETPWSKGHYPKNPREARERGGSFIACIAEPYRAGLVGLEAGMTVILLYWMGRAARDVLVQTPASKPHQQASSRCARPRAPIRLRSRLRGYWRLTLKQGGSRSMRPTRSTVLRLSISSGGSRRSIRLMTGSYGGPTGIRTQTGRSLSPLSLPVGV